MAIFGHPKRPFSAGKKKKNQGGGDDFWLRNTPIFEKKSRLRRAENDELRFFVSSSVVGGTLEYLVPLLVPF